MRGDDGALTGALELLARRGPASGLHLVLATARPSASVLTGEIKANIPGPIAFPVTSRAESRIILDQHGAEDLRAPGALLLLTRDTPDPLRLQGASVSTDDTARLMAWYRERSAERGGIHAAHGPDILEVVRAVEEGMSREEQLQELLDDLDPLFYEAALLCIQHRGGSTSLLQRRLKIGYGRAARIIDQLHFAGVLGPPDGANPREVLVDILGLDQILPPRTR